MADQTAPSTTLFRNGLVFDGTGAPGQQQDLLIRDGRVAAIGHDLPEDGVERVIDCAGKWVMPGLIDIHTHMDLEVELSPNCPRSFVTAPPPW